MSDARDPQFVIDAAELAAAAGDYALAEQLLREAAGLQEAQLGALSPDLANTLNNLGVVCEITHKPEDAEGFFQRAFEIASAALEPTHPFVATSRQNLEDFRATQRKGNGAAPAPVVPLQLDALDLNQLDLDRLDLDRLDLDRLGAHAPGMEGLEVDPIDVTPPHLAREMAVDADLVDSDRADSLGVDLEPRRTAAVIPPPVKWEEPTPPVARKSSRTLVIGAALAGLLIILILVGGKWFREPATQEPSAPSTSPAEQPATTPPEVKPGDRASALAPKETNPSRPAPAAQGQTAAGLKPAPIVVEAQICKDSRAARPGASNWRCDAPSQPVARGSLVFYTRVKSATDGTVQHRWYRGDKLRKSVDLPIRANPGNGYRTYSRYSVQDSGDWKVELRARDGAVLQEERFTVK